MPDCVCIRCIIYIYCARDIRMVICHRMRLKIKLHCNGVREWLTQQHRHLLEAPNRWQVKRKYVLQINYNFPLLCQGIWCLCRFRCQHCKCGCPLKSSFLLAGQNKNRSRLMLIFDDCRNCVYTKESYPTTPPRFLTSQSWTHFELVSVFCTKHEPVSECRNYVTITIFS